MLRQKNNLSHILNRFAEHLMNAVIIPNFRFITLVAGLLGALVSITAAQTVTLVVNNESNQALTFTPQLTVLSPAGDGTATLTAGTTPITVGPNDTNNQVSVSFNADPGRLPSPSKLTAALPRRPSRSFKCSEPARRVSCRIISGRFGHLTPRRCSLPRARPITPLRLQFLQTRSFCRRRRGGLTNWLFRRMARILR